MRRSKSFIKIIGMVLIAASLQAVGGITPAHAVAINGSLYFDDYCNPCSPVNYGGKQYVQMSAPSGSNILSFESNTAYTLEIWIKHDRTMGTGYGDIFGGPSWIAQIDNNGGTGWATNTGDRLGNQPGGAVIPSNVWAHYAAVHYSDNTFVEYVNGVAKSKTLNVTGKLGGTASQIYIGDGAGSVTHSIKGYLSNFRASKTAVYGTSAVSVNDSVFTPTRIALTATQSAGAAGSNINAITTGQTSVLLSTLYDNGDTNTAIANTSDYLVAVKNSDQSGQAATLPARDVPGPSPRSLSPFLSLSSSSENATSGVAISGYSTLSNSETYTATYGGTSFASLTTAQKNGLSFDATTGKISGAPTTTAAAKTFVIQGYTTGAGATFTVTVTAGQTITFPTVSGIAEGDSKALTASASSGLSVSYASDTPKVCSVSGGMVKAISGGTCTITASQAGDATYSAAANVSATFTISFSGKNNDEQDALVLALAGVAVGVASMMADVTTIATGMKSCYRGKITKKVMKNRSCPKGYSTKKLKVSGS